MMAVIGEPFVFSDRMEIGLKRENGRRMKNT